MSIEKYLIERHKADLRKICRAIGCSGESDNCTKNPQSCLVIRKVIKKAESEAK